MGKKKLPKSPSLPLADLITLTGDLFLRQLEVGSFRPSGSGGQKVNKTSSGVLLRYPSLGLLARCDQFREKSQNLKEALRALKFKMALCFTEPPSPVMMEKVRPALRKGLKMSSKNEMFPLLVAVLTGLFHEYGGDESQVASQLGVTPTSLRKFVLEHKKLVERINALRGTLGKPALRRS